MFLFDFFRSFLPLHNPIGFGASDFIEFTAAALMVGLLLLRAWMEPYARQFAMRTAWCMAVLAAVPVVLRLALLARHPIPTPSGADDFSYVLLADTLRHFRLANPAHPLREFFEAVFILQEPRYSSIFPFGQGLVLAFGWLVFGAPWAGVALSMATLCGLIYWMLRGWTTPAWALAGGLLAVMEFGPLNEWMNLYWGGAVSACAGCLVFGALPRLRDCPNRRDAAWLGLGLAIQVLARPFEFLLISSAAVLFFLPEIFRRAPRLRKQWRRLAPVAAVAGLLLMAAVALTLLQNKAVTGSWTMLPYQLSRYQYGVPTTFSFQPNPVPHRQLTPEQELDYQAQSIIHGNEPETPGSYLKRWAGRIRFYRFFFLTPLYLALPALLAAIRQFRFAWLLLVILLFTLGTNFYPYFYPHYVAAATCLFVLASVTALQQLSRLKVRGAAVGQGAARLILFLCAAQFAFWYGVHAFANENMLIVLGRFETWDFINYGDSEGRIRINTRLAEVPGKQLVFVRYGPRHLFHEWIHNTADVDAAKVVWAGDLGAVENLKLQQYYPDRSVWLVEPDALPPRLTPYRVVPKDRVPKDGDIPKAAPVGPAAY